MAIQRSTDDDRWASWEWTAVTGALLVILGGAVIGTSYLATLAISGVLGLALLVNGVVQLIHALRMTQMGYYPSRFITAILSAVAGLLILRTPAIGGVGITFVLAFYFLFAAAAKGTLIFEAERRGRKAWLILSSVASGVFGVYLLSMLRMVSPVVPGLLLGVDLIFYGFFEVGVSIALRKHERFHEEPKFRIAA